VGCPTETGEDYLKCCITAEEFFLEYLCYCDALFVELYLGLESLGKLILGGLPKELFPTFLKSSGVIFRLPTSFSAFLLKKYAAEHCLFFSKTHQSTFENKSIPFLVSVGTHYVQWAQKVYSVAAEK
jgi:hypothetical protein